LEDEGTILFGLELAGLFLRRFGRAGIQAGPDEAIIPGARRGVGNV
jgi:hypothetical protein